MTGGPRTGSPLRAALTVLLLLAAACTEVPPPPEEAGAWWLVEVPGYYLAAGGHVPTRVRTGTGHLWTLEYTDSRQTLQLSALARGNSADIRRDLPPVASATVGGLTATLTLHPGVPDDQIPKSVGAHWQDGETLISFGGGGLTEAELREHLAHVRRATRAEWEAAVAAVEAENRRLREDSPTETTGGLLEG